jgi:predicted transcriptional regulator of viral defense system
MSTRKKELIQFLKKNGKMASFSQINEAGFNKALIKACLASKDIEKLDRGLYILSKGMSPANLDFVAVSIKAPKGIICLISALSVHQATDEIPSSIDVAIPRGTHENKINFPPVKYYRFAPDAWEAGIENHTIDGHTVKIYSLAKTIADCFKFRNRIGINVARESLKIAITEKKVKPTEIYKYAKICRVDKIVKPILEAMI